MELCVQESPRGDTFTFFARVEFGGKSLKESDRLEFKKEEECHINLQFNHACKVSSLQSLDELAKYPLLGMCSIRIFTC